jgi:hypothetical protein
MTYSGVNHYTKPAAPTLFQLYYMSSNTIITAQSCLFYGNLSQKAGLEA